MRLHSATCLLLAFASLFLPACDRREAEAKKQLEGLQDLADVMSRIEAVQARYVAEHVNVFDVACERRGIRGVENTVPAVRFKLRNGGDKALRRVVVEVHLLDRDGSSVAKSKYRPVTAFDGEAGYSEGRPLAPGATWVLPEGQWFYFDSVPAQWIEGRVDVKIVRIDFSEAETERLVDALGN